MPDTFRKPRVFPLAWFTMAIISIICLDRWFPITTLVAKPYNWIGLALAIPGLIFTLHSGLSFLKAKTGLLPFSEASTLVTGGLYRLTRNPMYLGMAIFLAGLAVILGSLGGVIPVFLFIWIIDRQFIRNEEFFLLETFGAEYRDYMHTVRRWI